MEELREAIISRKSIEDFFEKLQSIINQKDYEYYHKSEQDSDYLIDNLNDIRKQFGLEPFEIKYGKSSYCLEK